MQIHELNTFPGTPTSTDYLAIDSGTVTSKIAATDLIPSIVYPVTDVQVNGTSVVTSTVANVQDSDFLSAATIAKWAGITGDDGSIDDVMDYQADHGEYKTLLWSNNSPTSSFVAQTVSVNLTNYSGVEVVWRWSTSDAGTFRQMFDKNTSSMIFAIANVRTYRELTVSDSGVQFTTGYYGNYDAAATSTAYYAIPLRIYGIK